MVVSHQQPPYYTTQKLVFRVVFGFAFPKIFNHPKAILVELFSQML
jgi:hypothetical protein